jgi:hypothetical protein
MRRAALGLCVALGIRSAAAQPAPTARDGAGERGTAAGATAEPAPALSARPQQLPAGAVQLEPLVERTAALPARPSLTRPRTPRVTNGLVRVPLSALPDPQQTSETAPRLDVFGIAAGAGRVDARAAEAPVLELPKGSFSVITSQRGKASIEEVELNTQQKTALPWLVVETAASAAEPEVRAGRPFLTLARAISWDAASARHIAEFLFGLDPERGEPGPLREALDVRFGVSCDTVSPDRAQIATIGPSGYDTVRVACSREVKNERERQYLELFAGQGNLRYPFRIPRRPGALVLEVTGSSTLPGFGLGTVTLAVQQLEEDGTPLVTEEAKRIQLSANGGGIDVTSVDIPPGASAATVQLRPSGIGQLDLSASTGVQRSTPVRLTLEWPLLPIGALLLGGALGGLVSALRPGQRRYTRRRIVEGAVMGLLVTLVVLVVPGLASVTAGTLASELGLFVVSAVAGFAGVPLVDRVARLVFPALEADAGRERRDDANAA